MVKPGYKQTEIGVIPEDWEVSYLSREYDLFAGGDLDVSDYSEVRTATYRYYILSNGLTNNGVYGFCSNPRYLGNSITITGRGDIGHCAYRSEPFSAIVRLLVCQPKCDIVSKYVSDYLIYAKPFVFESTGVPQLTVPQIKNTPIPKPTTVEQRCIAEALSDMDELIASLEKLIAKKKAIKQGAMQELLTGKRRLPGFAGEWISYTLGDLGSFIKGTGIGRKDSNSGSIPAVRYGELYTRHNAFVKQYYSYISEEVASKALQVFYGDVLFAASGETKEEIGKCAAIIDKNQVFVGGDILVFRPICRLDPVFMGSLLNTPQVCAQRAEKGQGDAIVHIHADALAGITFLLPCFEEQEAIAQIIMTMDIEISLLDQRLEKSRQTKVGIMQQLLTGKTRLV